MTTLDPLVARGIVVPARHLPEGKAARHVLAERHRSRPPAVFDPGTVAHRARMRELESSVCMDAAAVERKLEAHARAAREYARDFDNPGYQAATHPAITAAVAAGHAGTGPIDIHREGPADPRRPGTIEITWQRLPAAGAVVVTSPGRGRHANEDRAFAAAPRSIEVAGAERSVRIMGLFDGHGGAGNAQAASDTFAGHLEAALRLLGSPDWTSLDIWRAFKAASVWTSHGLPDFSGTTALTAAILGNELWVGQAGDSFAIGDLGQGLVRLALEQRPEDPGIAGPNAARGNETFDGRVGSALSPGRAWGHHALSDAEKARRPPTDADVLASLRGRVNERVTLTRFVLPPPEARAGCFVLFGSDGPCELEAASPMQVARQVQRRLAEGVAAEQAGAEAILATLRAEPHAGDNLSCLIVDLAPPRQDD